jgi:hypothetical protein
LLFVHYPFFSIFYSWLEQLVWSGVKRFITNLGKALRASREQLRNEGGADELSSASESWRSALPPRSPSGSATPASTLEGA